MKNVVFILVGIEIILLWCVVSYLKNTGNKRAVQRILEEDYISHETSSSLNENSSTILKGFSSLNEKSTNISYEHPPTDEESHNISQGLLSLDEKPSNISLLTAAQKSFNTSREELSPNEKSSTAFQGLYLLDEKSSSTPHGLLQSYEKPINISLDENSSSTSYGLLPSDEKSFNELLLSDEKKLINLENFTYLINNFPCDNDFVLLLVLVHSAPRNVEKRQTIRETWGKIQGDYRLLFLLGEVDRIEEQRSLEYENSLYKDLVQGNFHDDYRNLTYKHVMALKWKTYFCQKAKYLLKIDDDVFVNMPRLLKVLHEGTPFDSKRLISCNENIFMPILRSSKSKWDVSINEYPGKFYPPYCAGWVVLYSADPVNLLYREAQRTKYFWIDDVHVTGTLATKANLTRTAFKSFPSVVLWNTEIKSFVQKSVLSERDCNFLLAGLNLDMLTIRNLWITVQKCI